MRFDNIGLWWEDRPAKGKKGRAERPMPKIPENAVWTAPTTFPDLRRASVIGLDTETYDPELTTRGPGWARGVGHIVGISVATSPADAWYFPMRHETRPETNLDPAAVLAWAQDNLSTSVPKVGANIMYDVGWLRQEGVQVGGPLIDVQYAEALINENNKTALDNLSKLYQLGGKVTEELYVWLSDWFGGEPGPKQRKWLYRAPPCLVGPYAEADAYLPVEIIKLQYQLLRDAGLLEVFDMENRLIRLLLDMRFAGVRVDLEKAAQVSEAFTAKEKAAQERLNKLAGTEVNVDAGDSLAHAFDKIGLPYGKTSTGRPSFTAGFLDTVEHPVGALVREVRKYAKARGTFVDSYILDSNVDGVLYGSFHPLRGDENGAVSGRFASSNPNLQNIPSRDEEIKQLVRGMFVPDTGHMLWRSYDYSQIEYRLLAHFAVGPGSGEIRKIFNDDPHTDFHEIVRQLVKNVVGVALDRKPTKNINFGLCYGMGEPKLAATLGLVMKEAKRLFAAYHAGAPFVKATFDHYVAQATQTGEVRTLLNRRARFDLWEPLVYDERAVALPYEEAYYEYGSVRRAFTHKALNRVLQGSAADVIKAAMLKCYDDGVFDETGVPRITVHDELNFSDPGGKDTAFEEMRHIMETAVPCSVPLLVDYEHGPNWGDLQVA